MAGAGVRVFSSGEILTAAQVNQYLMDQVVARFADAATRDASFGGAGQPTLTEGRLCYLDSTNAVQIYDGSSWNDASQFTVGDGTITTNKLAANSVTSDKIAPGTVVAADIAAGTVTATELADGAVTSAKILDGTIVNADINASAAIDKTKISGTAITAGDTGTVTSTMILDGTIVNADINASAAIALSKLAPSTAGNIIVYNSSGVPTAVAETGDVTIDSSGVSAISSGVIVNADINASASIDYSKLNLSGSITTTDLATGAARAGFRSAGAGTGVTLTSNNYNIVVADLAKLVEVGPSSANATVTITAANDANFTVGDRVDVLQTTGTYTVTIQGTGGVTINAYDSALKLQGQWACATLIKRASNTWVAVGNLTT